MGIDECFTCEFMRNLDTALVGVDETLFNNLSIPVGAVLGGIMLVSIMYRIQIIHFLETMNEAPKKIELFNDMSKNVFWMCLAAFLLGTSDYWRDYVIGNINNIIGYLATEVINASSAFTETAETSGGIPVSTTPTAEDLFSPQSQSNIFQKMMSTVYTKSYEPLDRIMKAFSTTGFDVFKDLSNIPVMLFFVLSMWFAYFMAAISNMGFFLILAMHKIMTTFVVGMGPLIILLWTFEGSRHYGKSMLRFLLATGSIVIGASFLVSMALAVISNSVVRSGLLINTSEGEQINLSAMSSWVLSSDFPAFVSGYVGLVFMILISVLLGVTVILAQRPQLDK